jgi:hypothetical protein
MKTTVFWDAAPCSLVEVYQRLALMMVEAACISETLVNIYQTTRRNIPGDNHLHTRRRENLKSHLFMEIYTFKEAGRFSETLVTLPHRHDTMDIHLPAWRGKLKSYICTAVELVFTYYRQLLKSKPDTPFIAISWTAGNGGMNFRSKSKPTPFVNI